MSTSMSTSRWLGFASSKLLLKGKRERATLWDVFFATLDALKSIVSGNVKEEGSTTQRYQFLCSSIVDARAGQTRESKVAGNKLNSGTLKNIKRILEHCTKHKESWNIAWNTKNLGILHETQRILEYCTKHKESGNVALARATLNLQVPTF